MKSHKTLIYKIKKEADPSSSKSINYSKLINKMLGPVSSHSNNNSRLPV
jgi:hypothetical protein